MLCSLHYWLLHLFSLLATHKLRQVTWRATHKFSFGLRFGVSMKDIKIAVFKPFLCKLCSLCLGSLSCRNTNQDFLQDSQVFYCIHLFTLYPNKPSRPCSKATIIKCDSDDVMCLAFIWMPKKLNFCLVKFPKNLPPAGLPHTFCETADKMSSDILFTVDSHCNSVFEEGLYRFKSVQSFHFLV